MTCLQLIFLCRFARPDQIPERFVRCVWYPHRRQFPGAIATRQFLGIPPIGFDPSPAFVGTRLGAITWHSTPKLRELPVKNVTGRAGLVTDLQILLPDPTLDQLANRLQPIRNGPVRANLPILLRQLPLRWFRHGHPDQQTVL